LSIKAFSIVSSAIIAIIMLAYFKSPADETPEKLVPVLKIDTNLDNRTEVKPSIIPGAGNGLFAAVKIKQGEVIGHLGGRLRTAEDYPAGNHYIASIAECAWEETAPYRYLDSKEYGGNVRRINFAPSKINGTDTGFQNAAIRQLCAYPYFIFVALKDIEPGAEIWASYGPHYDYERFMQELEVRNFFCARAKIDCAEKYSYDH
jgi:SET domain-containing protein